MELINPTLTVQNTDQSFWLVRMEHAFSDCEHLDMQFKLQRSLVPLDALQAQLVRTAIERLQALLAGLSHRGTPGTSDAA